MDSYAYIVDSLDNDDVLGLIKYLNGYEPRHFNSKELVPKEVHDVRGSKSLQLLDSRALFTLDQLREKFGSCTVNTPWNGTFNESGLRTKDCKYFKPYSQHSFGRAFDCKFSSIDAWSVREYICKHPKEFPFITFLEEGEGISWVHFDVRNSKGLTVWNIDDGSVKLY